MTNNTPLNISWHKEEIEQWVAAGLVPEELLHPSKFREFADYIATNYEMLTNHYKYPSKEETWQVTLPPIEELDKTYELQVIDTITGKVVKVLNKAAHFELCDGAVLQVNAKELEKWKRETKSVKSLSKEQKDDLKSFISQKTPDRPLTRKEIVTFIEEIRKPKKTRKYRQAGHLGDQKLKYTSQKNKPLNLLTETLIKIKDSKLEIKAEGIKLTVQENKLVHALNRILFDKSENSSNSKASDFYEGNMKGELCTYGQIKTKPAVIRFKPAELYKAYVGHDKYSGHDINFIHGITRQLESKKVLIRYDRVKKVEINKTTEERTDRIEDFQPLIKIKSFIPDLTNEEKERLNSGDNSIRDTKGEIIIELNPIFTDQIDTKFIEYPVDTNRRLVIAAGGHRKVTESMTTLMEWAHREISAKRYKSPLNEDTLHQLLGLEKYVKQNRKKRLEDRIAKDIEAITNMGIILSHERVNNETGGLKYVFKLNKDYQ